MVAAWLLLGMALGIETRGFSTRDDELMRFGQCALLGGGLLIVGVLAALPVRWIPGMWRDEETSFVERTVAVVAGLGSGLSLALGGLKLSPWSEIATATALLAATTLVVAFLLSPPEGCPRELYDS